ncbi:hypothetical protein E2751_10030 [Salmonella enterica]|nr:hypothetical protein [Salmonella enterica]EDY3377964.1 hypothetical protein [Salmonella enterica]HAU3151417.1 hypothetical protein [Salmonella enterica subsp. diarizonae]
MTSQELDACISGSGRRSVASALIAFILDALDDGQEGVDLDTFLSHTRFVRNNVTTVASYLQLRSDIQKGEMRTIMNYLLNVCFRSIAPQTPT